MSRKGLALTIVWQWLDQKLTAGPGVKLITPLIIALIPLLFLLEHLSLPLPQSDMRIPAAYQQIAAAPGDFSLLDIPFKGMKLGMNFSNLGGRMKLDGRDLTREYDLNPDNTLNTGVETRLRTQDWDLPVNFRVGLAMEILGEKASFYQNENNQLTFAVDGNHRRMQESRA